MTKILFRCFAISFREESDNQMKFDYMFLSEFELEYLVQKANMQPRLAQINRHVQTDKLAKSIRQAFD